MDKYIKEFFLNKKNLITIFLIAITIISLIIRIQMINFESWDFTYCIKDWIEQIINMGGIKSLKYEIGNYNVVYMTFLTVISYFPIKSIFLVKGFSILFDYITAIYSALLIGEILKNKSSKSLYQILTYSFVILLPTMLMNSALWGQCDSIYTAFTLISIYYMYKEKIFKSFIFAGLAFSFKLQFIFILPLYIFIYFKNKKISIYHFLIIPFINFITCLPAILMGRSIKDCLLIYFKQTGQQNIVLTNNFPNIYRFIDVFLGSSQGTISVLLTLSIVGIIIFILLYKNIKINKETIINISLLFIIIITQFLPYMHERYAFTAEILLVLYIIINKGKGLIYLILTQLTISSEYLSFLSNFNQQYIDLLTISYVIGSLWFCYSVLKKLIDDNEIIGKIKKEDI